LSAVKLKSLKPKDRVYRVLDSDGLRIEVRPSGKKFWRYRYRWQGRDTMLSLGEYPAVSLAQARQMRDEAKALLARGVNPADALFRQDVTAEAEPDVMLFRDVWRAWFEHARDQWTGSYERDVQARCEKHLLPVIGGMPVNEIRAADLLKVFRRMEAQGSINTMHKVRSYASRAFRFGVGMGWCERDPVQDLPMDVLKPDRGRRMAFVRDPAELAGILRAIDGYSGRHYAVGEALWLAPYLFLRPGELAGLLWSEVDFSQNLIRIGAERMKMRRVHLVPMARQVREKLEALRALDVDSPFVFPSHVSLHRPISPESLRAALRRMGITKDELTTHGFRHIASTFLNELGWPPDAIERQLAHVEGNKVRRAYNHAEYLDVRREMMQAWADWLDEVRGGCDGY
ncbi:tyrosine-type recombinase/integrase, partial [Sulfurivirga sp.]|uniref:tyrosine-type recombinase/integrase n=1 Tax=Sulfurivirga sp. TaxID=2614236 RepID=UPI0025EBFA64